MRRIYFPLKLKLTLWYVMLLLIVITAFSITIYVSLEKMIINNEDSLLKTQSQQIISSIDIENGKVKITDEPFYINTNFYGALLSYPDLKPLETNIPNDVLNKYTKNSTNFIGTFKTISSGDDHFRIYSSPIYSDNKILAIIVLSQPLNLMETSMKNLSSIILFLIPIVIFVAIIGGLLISNRALKPISHMINIAREISVGDLSKRLNLTYTNDEIGRLAQTFDIMIERLENSFKRQKQFTHDASHELRTPVAVIQSQAESALNTKRSDEEYIKALTVILDEAKHMGKLISNLLFLARSDSNSENLTMENLNYSEIVEGVVLELQPIASNNNIDLKLIKNEPSYILGDQTRITQLLYNIIDNAIKYTLPGGKIKVYVENKKDYIKTSIEDTGIGISQEDISHIFERFYRSDKSRSRKDGGTGLGLSISNWIATVHGGKIDVTSKIGKGSIFTIWLPSKKK